MGCSASTTSGATAEGVNRPPKRRASQSTAQAVVSKSAVNEVKEDPLARIHELIIPSADDTIAVEAFKLSLRNSGDAFLSKYKVLQERVGWGSRSTVSRAVRLEDQRLFAVKVVDMALEDAAREVHLLDSLHRDSNADVPDDHSHRNASSIPRIVDVFASSNWRPNSKNGPQQCHEWVMVLQPWCDGPSLADFVEDQNGGLDEGMAVALTRQLLEMLCLLHARKVVHRGLKPESVMFLSSDTSALPVSIFVTNLHDAVSLHDAAGQQTVTRCPPEYVAPEVACGYRATTAADMWSLGVLVFLMLCGGTPFRGRTDDETLALVKASRYVLEPESHWVRVSPNGKDFVRKLLQERPNARPTAEQALQHPWFAG